jgi:hypothetical protein
MGWRLGLFDEEDELSSLERKRMKREKNNYKCNRDEVIHVSGRKRKKINKKKLFFLRTKSITFFKFIKNEKRETKNGKMCK